MKRALKGTYVSVEPFHPQAYADEQAFRYNNREMTDAERFSLAVSGIVGKHNVRRTDRQGSAGVEV